MLIPYKTWVITYLSQPTICTTLAHNMYGVQPTFCTGVTHNMYGLDPHYVRFYATHIMYGFAYK